MEEGPQDAHKKTTQSCDKKTTQKQNTANEFLKIKETTQAKQTRTKNKTKNKLPF